MLGDLKKDMQNLANPKKAKLLAGFFKTGKGDYGEGDIFLGIQVPESRKIAKRYKDLELLDIERLLHDRFHEYKLVALLILVQQYEKNENLRKLIYDFYIKNARYTNNWDLVDLTAPKIVGAYLFDKDKSILYELAKSDSLWERRISIISTFHFIYYGKTKYTYKIAKILLSDKHDLIQKAVGWMLREAGKRVSQDEEEEFLKKYCKTMPKTMLRYAIERFDPKTRGFYMKM